MSDQIKRSIYYYELFALEHDRNTNNVYKDRTCTYINAFFEQLSSNQEGIEDYTDFIINTSQGAVMLIVDKVASDNTYFFRIALCRENALPYIEKGGKLESLGSYIDRDQNIVEITHCIYFGAYGIIGAEYNYNGARCPIIADYIMKSDEQVPTIQCHPKLNNDTYNKIVKDKDFSLFEIAVRTNSDAYTKVLSQKSIFSAIQSSVPEADIFEVTLKKRKTKKNGNKGFPNPLSETEMLTLITDYREDLIRFKLSQSSLSECIDLLSDKFVGKTTLIKTEERTIDSSSMYAVIFDFFKLNVEEYCERRKGA